MAIVPVAAVAASSTDGLTATATANTSTANLLVVKICWLGGGKSVIPVDTKSNSWTARTKVDEGGGFTFQYFDCFSPTVGTGHGVTATNVTDGAQTFPEIEVLAFSGAAASPFSSDDGGGSVAGATSIQPPAITPPSNGCLVISMLGNTSGSAATIDSGFTATSVAYSPGEAVAGGSATLVQTTAAAANPTWSWPESVNAAAINAVYLPAAGPTAGTLSTGSVTSTTAAASIATNTGGTSPYSNQLQTSPHGAGSWTNNGSPVAGATASLTATGLTASTQYDLRVVVTDSASGTSTSNTVTQTTSASGPTTTWQTSVFGFAPGLVGGTTSGFGYKVGLDGGSFGSLITSGIIEDSPGSYSARPAVAASSMPRFRWFDGSGLDSTDYSPLALPGTVSFPSTLPAGSINRAAFAADMIKDGTMRASSSGGVVHFDAADRIANGATGTVTTNQYIRVVAGTGLGGPLIPIATVSGSTGTRDGTLMPGAADPGLDASTDYVWSDTPTVSVSLPPAAKVVSGSGTTLVVTGYPAGKNWDLQRVYHVPSGESRMVASHSYSSPNYTLTLVGSFSFVTAGDAVCLLS